MDLKKLREIQEAIEKERRINQAIGPIDKIVREQKALNELEGLGQALKRLNEISATSRLSQLQAFKFETPEWVNATQLLAKRLRADIDLIEQAFRVSVKPIADLFRQAEIWNQQLNSVINNQYRNLAIAQALSAGAVWRYEIERLARAIQAHRIDIQFPALTDRLFRPSEYFTRYAQSRTERLNSSESESESAVLRGALDLAATEFSDGVSLTESLIEPELGIVEPTKPVIYNLYEEQEQELILLVSKDGSSRIEDIPSLFSLMKTREIAQLTGGLFTLVATCNQESRTRGGEDIFRLTNAIFEASADLPNLIVKNKDSLAALIRHLYRLIYEGAGSDKLRFLSKYGGCLDDGDCDAIWNLKALRNKLILHDPEHGDQATIRSNYATLEKALRKLRMSGLPVTENEFLALQKALLSQLKDFLTNLALKMRK